MKRDCHREGDSLFLDGDKTGEEMICEEWRPCKIVASSCLNRGLLFFFCPDALFARFFKFKLDSDDLSDFKLVMQTNEHNPVPDVTAFWRPALKTCPSKHCHLTATTPDETIVWQENGREIRTEIGCAD